MVQLFIGYCFPRMLMPCSIMFNFCLLMRKAKIFCGFAHTLLHSLYIYEIYLLNIYVLNYFFISIKKPSCWLIVSFTSTGRQRVCVVPMETPASGKSGLDPGCQFGGWAVSRLHFATWKAQPPKTLLSHKCKGICVKVV